MPNSTDEMVETVTYKEIKSISDEYALKIISLLFYGFAATLWQGMRKMAKTWNDALALIHENFATTKPAYQIYLEIFDKKQNDSTDIDTYVCRKRTLLAQLPDSRHDKETEIDFIYLLNIKYRQQIGRQDVKSLRELLDKGRIVEYNMMYQIKVIMKRCTYCRFRGHTHENGHKRKATGATGGTRTIKAAISTQQQTESNE